MKSHSGNWVRLAKIVACVGLFGVPPAAAQDRADESVFVDLGRWTIVERARSRYCELRLNSNSVDGLVFTKANGQPGSLRLGGGNDSGFTQGPVSWQFDSTQFDGQVLRGGLYAPVNDSSQIEQQFRQAKTLTVRQGGQVLAQLSLKTSSAGFRLLNQCADQWRGGFAPIRSTAPPAPSIASRTVAPPPSRPSSPPPITRPQRSAAVPPPRATGPFPPNRGLTALNPGGWVRADDFRRLSGSRFGSGTVRFTLLVNERGRVEECAVNASSGSRDFDAKACRSLQKRARFEPATDANGDARSARYSSSVRFAVSE